MYHIGAVSKESLRFDRVCVNGHHLSFCFNNNETFLKKSTKLNLNFMVSKGTLK